MKRLAWCFVTVEWQEKAARAPVPNASSFSLRPSRAPGGRLLVARTGTAGHCWTSVLDEHLAVDADVCRDPNRLECADVLHGSPRPAREAARWLADVWSSKPGCRLAAVPLTEGGWAVRGGTDPDVVTVPCRVPPEQWLFVSCLHAWLVAGLPLSEISAAHPQVRLGPTSPSVGERRPDL